jgi:hypothetical protein
VPLGIRTGPVLTFKRLPGGVGFQTPVAFRCASARIARPIALHALEALEHSNFPSQDRSPRVFPTWQRFQTPGIWCSRVYWLVYAVTRK